MRVLLRLLILACLGIWLLSCPIPNRAAPVGTDEPSGVADLYVWLTAQGGAVVGLRVDEGLTDRQAVNAALTAALGSELSVIPQGERWNQAQDWDIIGQDEGLLKRHGTLREGRLDPTPLLPVLRRQGVEWLTVNIQQQDMPYSHYIGIRLIPEPGRAEMFHSYSVRTSHRQARPVQFSYGYTSRDAWGVILPLGLVLLLPVGLTLWMRARALRAEGQADMDPAVVWFGYGRFLQWLAFLPWLVWVPVVLAVSAPRFLGFIVGTGWPAHSGLTYFVLYLPALVIVWCYGLSHPVFARVRGLEWTRAELVRQAAWGQSRILPLLCVLMGISEVFSNPRLGIVWFGAALLLRVVTAQGAMRAMGTVPMALTVGDLRDRVFALAAQAGVKVNQVYVLPAGKGRMANAFAAVGNNVLLTDYLLERLSRREVDAVIAHELTHLRRGHPRALTLLFLLLWIGAALSANVVVARTTLPLLAGASYVVTALLGLLLAYFFSRRFEHTADAGAVTLTNDPAACITGLSKLAQLNQMPMDWGKQHERWMTHPPTARRVAAIARQGGVSEEKLRNYTASAETPGEEEHYALPPGLRGATAFSSVAKLAFRQKLAWACIGVIVLVPALTALLVSRSEWDGAVAWGIELLGLVATAVIYQAVINAMQLRWDRALERNVRANLSIEGVSPLPDAAHFATFAPAAHPRLYEGFFDWDVGFLSLYQDRLCFRGEQAQFSLPRNQFMAAEIRTDTPGWQPWARVYIRWQNPASELTNETATFNIRPGVTGPRKQSQQAARDLCEHLREWRDGNGAFPDAPEDSLKWSLPVTGEVTAQSPRVAARGPVFLTSLLLQVILALAVSVLFALPTSGDGYVTGVTALMTVFTFIPYWRYRDQSAGRLTSAAERRW